MAATRRTTRETPNWSARSAPRPRAAGTSSLAGSSRGKTATAAAQVAGISERQLYRWLELPEFQTELKTLESQLIDAATRRLLVGIDTALDTLHSLMIGAESEAVKRQAASDWLTKMLTIRELQELEERLRKIEKELNL